MKGAPRALVTGATSGLGREMAVQLARRGWRVALTGRRREKLDAAARAVKEAGGDCLALLGDVADLAVVKNHYAEIRRGWGGLDWAILNAGVADSRNAREFSAQNYHWTFATNVGGAVNWMEVVLPDMLAARSGTIAGIASLAAWRGLPESGAYSASKAALVTLLESTRADLQDTGVRVVTVCPGYVKSELTDRSEPGSMPFLLETEEGARRIIEGIERGSSVVHFPWQLSWVMKYLVKPMPDFLYDRIISRFAKRKKRPYLDESKARQLPPNPG